jgi:hypothetical protein
MPTILFARKSDIDPMAVNVAKDIADIRSTLETLDSRIQAESDERKKEGAAVLQAIEAIIKTMNSESEDHMTQFSELRKMFTDAKQGISSISSEVEKQKAGTAEFLSAVNSMKAALDLEQCDHLNKHKEFASWIADAKASVEVVKGECEKQQKTNDELMLLINSLKTVVDKECQERIDNRTVLDAHIGTTDGIKTNVMKQIDAQRSSTEELLRVINALKDSFDREQHESVVKHSEILKCIEDTHSALTESVPAAGTKEIVDRLRRLRMDANTCLGHPDLSNHSKQPPSPIQNVPSSNQLSDASPPHQPAQAGTPPRMGRASADEGALIDREALKDVVMREVAQSSISKDVFKEVVVQEVAQASKKTMEAMEQERKDREDRYLLLHSQLANFQYDFAVERNERTQLHGELISLKSDLVRKVDLVSQDMRAIQAGEKQGLPRPLSSQVGMVDSSAVTEIVKLEVARVLSEQPQEKSRRESDALDIETKIAALMKEFTKRVERMEAISYVNNSKSRENDDDLLTRAEFENQYRRILDAAVGADAAGIARDEFEDHLQRIWEAIMQLQAKQLEELREKNREAAMSQGLNSQKGSIRSPQQKGSTKAILVEPASSPSSNMMLKNDRSSPMSGRRSGSPYRNAVGRSIATSGHQSPSQAASTNVFMAPAPLMTDNLIATSLTMTDALTPRSRVGVRTPGVPQYRSQ